MTLEESREVIPMMETMINQIEEQQNFMAAMVQELQERGSTAPVFLRAEPEFKKLKQRIIQAAKFRQIQKNCSHRSSNRKPESNSWKTRISNGRN